MIRTFDDLELKYVKEALDRGQLGWIVEGGLQERFEKAFAEYTGAKIALSRNNAMNALAEAVAVSGATAGNEVLCDPIVHFGAVAALWFNAVPRFVDVDYETYNMDPDSLRANITDLSRAVIVTHHWGYPAKIDEIRQICDEHGLFLIEDCAHATGCYYQGKHVGTFGQLGVFSFQEYKQLSTGDGGMTITDNEELADKMANVWAFSGESPNFMTLNWRMNEVTAAIGLGQLQRVQGYLDDVYNVTLRILDNAIKDCAWLRTRKALPGSTTAGYWWACTWEGDKYGLSYDQFKELNDKLGIGLRFGFNHTPPYEFDLFRGPTAYKHPDCPIRCPYYVIKSDYRYLKGLCPVTEDLMPRLVTVGLIFLTVEEAKETADKLQEAISVMG
jgi:dTDP-4-amino-4,6-dideoxygalactose transaminase